MYTWTGPFPLCPSECTVTDGSSSPSSYASIVGSPSWSSVKYSHTGNAFITFFRPSTAPPGSAGSRVIYGSCAAGPNFNGNFTPMAFSALQMTC